MVVMFYNSSVQRVVCVAEWFGEDKQLFKLQITDNQGDYFGSKACPLSSYSAYFIWNSQTLSLRSKLGAMCLPLVSEAVRNAYSIE